MGHKPILDVTTYIASFPVETQNIMNKMRTLILTGAPDAIESIAYGMPAYKTYGKPLIYFAGYKNHIGWYALPSGQEAFSKELQGYKQGKGSVQFPLDAPIPFDLLQRIVAFRVAENKSKYGGRND